MRLHDLLDDLRGSTARACSRSEATHRRSTSAPSCTTAATCSPGALFCCIRGARHRRPRPSPPAAVAAGAVALLVEEWLAARRPAGPGRLGARGARPARAHASTAQPSQAMRVLGVTGTNGKTTTTYLLEAIARAAGDRAGVIGTVAARVGDRVAADRAHDARGDRAAGAARARCATTASTRSRWRCRRTRSTSTASTAPLRRRRASRTSRTTTSTTTDRVDAYFEAKARLFTPRVHAPGRDQHRRRARRASSRAARGRRRARRRHGSRSTIPRPTSTRPRTSSSRPDGIVVRPRRRAQRQPASGPHVAGRVASTSRTRSRPRPPRCSPASSSTRSSPGSSGRSWCRAGWSGSTRARTSRCSSTTRTRPTRSTPALGGGARLAGAGGRLIVVFGCGGDRDRAKRPLMGEIAARLADLAFSPPTTRAPRTRRRSSATSWPACPTGRDGRDASLDRRAAIRDALAAARPGDVVVIAGKGHETGQTVGGRTDAVRRPASSRARGAGDALVTESPRPRSRRACRRRRRRGIARRDGHVVGVRLARARRRARASSRCAASATVTTSSPARSPRAPASRSCRPRRPTIGRPPGAALVQVDDALVAAAGRRAVAAARLAPSCASSASTGSTGKTSTKDLLAAVLAPLGCYANAGVVQQRVRPADHAAQRARRRERRRRRDGGAVPRRRRGAVRDRAPEIGVVTNVGLAHAEHLGGAAGAAQGDGRAARRAADRGRWRC